MIHLFPFYPVPGFLGIEMGVSQELNRCTLGFCSKPLPHHRRCKVKGYFHQKQELFPPFDFLKFWEQSEKCNFCNLHFSRCFLRGARLLHYSINITLLYFIFLIRYPHVSPPPTTPKVQVAKVAKLTKLQKSVNIC